MRLGFLCITSAELNLYLILSHYKFRVSLMLFDVILQSNDIRNIAAEGLAKLLLSGRVLSAKLLSRLILLWYNPTTEEDGNLRHCIGVFLPVFAFASRYSSSLQYLYLDIPVNSL